MVLEKPKFDFSWRRLLYTICFLSLCFIDQRTKTGSGLDGIIETCRNSMAIVMAIILMSHYKWGDITSHQIPYLIWSILSIVGGVAAFLWGMSNRPFLNEWIVTILSAILWGYVLIHTFMQVLIEKKIPKIKKGFGSLWAVMLLWMLCSRSHYTWPFYYLVMFGCFYLTDFTKEEKMDMLNGWMDGVIAAFILFQGFCCVFRPLDEARYIGIYNNPNANALFYLEVLAVMLIRVLILNRQKAAKWLVVLYWLGTGCAMGFLFMTIGRIAWITAFIMGLLFLAFLDLILQKKRFICNGLLLVLCTVVMFVASFGVTRYLPPVFHHPVWFWGEWAETKVHSWEPWNSENYIDMDEFLEAALGRIVGSIQNVAEHSSSETIVSDMIEVAVPETAGESAENMEVVLEEDSGEWMEESSETPIVESALDYDKYAEDSFMIRSTIYKYYIADLNFAGHPYEEQGFQMFPTYWIGHAHNIYLQYGTDFGIPVMIMFVILSVWSIVGNLLRAWKQKSIKNMAALFVILIPLLFGMFEYSWGVGSLTMTMLFLAWRTMIVDE